MIWKGVLASRAHLAANRFRRGASPGGRWQTLIGVLLFGWFFLLVFAALAATFSRFDDLGLGAVQAGALLAVALVGSLTGVLVFDLQYAVSAVLLDSDLELLRRAPLAPGQVLMVKIVDSLPRTAALIGAVALPACLAFGVAMGIEAWGWGLLPFLLAGLWATPLGVGLAVALVVLRVAPARRVREILAVLSTFVLLILWITNSFLLPRLLDAQGDPIEILIHGLTPAGWVVALSPPHWAASALVAAGQGMPLAAVGWTARVVLAGIASLALAGVAGRLLLDDVLARVAAGDSARPRRRAHAGGAPAGGIVALLLKDARLFTRDWAVLGDVLTASLLWTLLPLVAGPLHRAPPALLARFMMVALAVGLGYEVGARTLPYEGPALAWSRLAPLPPWRWNLAKWAGGALISLPLIAVAAVVVRVALPIAWSEWGSALVASLAALTLSLALGLWTGWTFGDPAWTNPRAMLTLTGRLIASGLLVAQAAAWLILLAVADAFGAPRGVMWWGPPALAASLAVPIFALAVRAGTRREGLG